MSEMIEPRPIQIGPEPGTGVPATTKHYLLRAGDGPPTFDPPSPATTALAAEPDIQLLARLLGPPAASATWFPVPPLPDVPAVDWAALRAPICPPAPELIYIVTASADPFVTVMTALDRVLRAMDQAIGRALWVGAHRRRARATTIRHQRRNKARRHA